MERNELENILPKDVLEQMYEWIHKHKINSLLELYRMFLIARLNGSTKLSFCDWFTKRYEE